MMPRDHTLTFGPYSLRMTTSGAIQYGVPDVVVRFVHAGPNIRARKPKPANVGEHGEGQIRSGEYIMIRTEFNVTSKTQQYIVALDVAMDDAMLMHMLQALRHLPAHCSDLPFCHQVRRSNVRERATLHILHHHPELILIKKRVDVVDDICMTRSPHYEDLVYDEIFFWLLIQVHLLDRNWKIRPELVGGEHATRGTTRAPRRRIRSG